MSSHNHKSNNRKRHVLNPDQDLEHKVFSNTQTKPQEQSPQEINVNKVAPRTTLVGGSKRKRTRKIKQIKKSKKSKKSKK
jgi:hypothetical protein